jgi:hypothetical protein
MREKFIALIRGTKVCRRWIFNPRVPCAMSIASTATYTTI